LSGEGNKSKSKKKPILAESRLIGTNLKAWAIDEYWERLEGKSKK
jgi:hypothetical protein